MTILPQCPRSREPKLTSCMVIYMLPWLGDILSLDSDNNTNRNESHWLSTHKYSHSFQLKLNSNHDPLSNPWLCPPTSRKKCYCRFHRIHACENFFRMKNVFIIDNDHISPFKKEPASCSRQIKIARKGNQGWGKGGGAVWRRFELFGYTS